jgi:hypothetical protein
MSDQDQTDFLDIALQQSQMLFFCIPYVGPALAAVTSIWEAIRQANKVPTREHYSVEMAIADLGDQIQQSIALNETEQLRINTKAWLMKSATRDWMLRTAAHDPDTTSVVHDFQSIDSDSTDIMWGLMGDEPGSLKRWIVPVIQAGDFKTLVPPVDPLSWGSTFFQPANDRTLVEADVVNLDMYCMAHAAYHAMCHSYLVWGAAAYGYEDWNEIGGPVRLCYEKSLTLAVDHLSFVLSKLQDTFANMNARALADADVIGDISVADKYLYSTFFTKKLRSQRHEAFIDIDPKNSGRAAMVSVKMDTYLQFLSVFGQTLQGLNIPENKPTVDLGAANWNPPSPVGGGGSPASTPTPGGLTLGARAAQSVRFLYDSDPTGQYVNVVANSTVMPTGLIATQNAGSAKVGLYYQIGGLGLNLQFANQLVLAGQLDHINTNVLPNAYDAAYGAAGQWATDHAAKPTRQDRLTSVLIALQDGDPIGDRVVAMIYSAAPELGATLLSNATDAAQYTAIYMDALARIADWNTNHPKATIEGFRITMLSTGINSGLDKGPALDTLKETIAGLIVDAVVASMKAKPALAGLTILVNNSDATDGAERLAFDAAAKAAKLTNSGVVLAREGFDIPY